MIKRGKVQRKLDLHLQLRPLTFMMMNIIRLSAYRPRRHSKRQSVSKTHLWTRHGYSAVATADTTVIDASPSSNSDAPNTDANNGTSTAAASTIVDTTPSFPVTTDAELLREQQELAAALFYKPR